MDAKTLEVEKRSVFGRKVGSLRRAGVLPANIYGKNTKSLSVQVKHDQFLKVYKEVGETRVVEIDVAGQKRPVLIHHVQKNPVDDSFLHVDFLQVDLKAKVITNIPVEYVNESPAEKQGLGVVVTHADSLEVESLPADLPEKFEVDLSNLEEVDQMIQVKDLVFDKNKISLQVDPETILAKVEPPQKEEEVAPIVEAGTETAETLGEAAEAGGDSSTQDEGEKEAGKES